MNKVRRENVVLHYTWFSESSMGTSWWQMKDYEHERKEAREEYAVIWNAGYATIGQINNIMQNIQKRGSGAFRYYDYYMGEALGIRAFVHFDLLRLFAPHVASRPNGRGIPYVTVWGNRVTPFSSVEQVYKVIISDLKQSESLLERAEKLEDDGKTTFLKNRYLHFNLDAARATLARVYWMEGELDSARLYAEKVIVTEKYELLPKTGVKEMMTSVVAKRETIWGIYQVSPFGNMRDDLYSNIGLLPRGDIFDFYKEGGNDSDVRQNWFRLKTPKPDSDNDIYFLKFFNERANQNPNDPTLFGGITGFSMIRISEMYYIAAEGYLGKDPEKATEYYDRVAGARGRTPFKLIGRQVTLEDINEERFREFFGEGYEWYNMKRQNRNLYIPSTPEPVEGTDKLYTLTIPYEEFDYREEE